MLLQYFRGSSPLHRMDALSKFFWVFLVGITAFLVFSAKLLGVLVLAILLTVLLLGRIPARKLFRGLVLIFSLGAAVCFFQLLFNKTGDTLVGASIFRITTGGLGFGLLIGARTIAFALTSLIFVWVTDPRDFVIGLIRLGFPYRAGFAAFVGLRFVPILEEELRITREAQLVRGVAETGRSLRGRLEGFKRVAVPVFVSVIRRAENTAIAMDSRAFGAYKRRTYLDEFKWSPSGLIFLGVFLLLSVALCYLALQEGTFVLSGFQGFGTTR